MKWFFLLLPGILLFNASLYAQMGVTTQRGKATQELKEEGLFAAHNRFPLDATVRLINPDNGIEIEVTIIDRIPVSPGRIIDLTSDAWDALELTRDTVITLKYGPYAVPDYKAPEPEEEIFMAEEPPPPPPPPPPSPTPSPPPPRRPPVTTPSSAPRLYHLLVLDRTHSAGNADITVSDNMDVLYQFNHDKNGHIVALYTSSDGPVYPGMPDKSNILVDLITEDKSILSEYISTLAFKKHISDPKAIIELQKILAGIITPIPPDMIPLDMIPPGMKIIPGIPDANTDKIYYLQVGAFVSAKAAGEMERKLVSAGFETAREVYGSLNRIVTAGISAADIISALRRLYAAGFSEVWIRE